MRQAYNALSIILIGLCGYLIVAGAISYGIEIQKPLQGGWNSYRLTEFAIQFTPYFLSFGSLIATRVRGCPKWLFFTAMTWLLFWSVIVVIGCVKAALFLSEDVAPSITLLVFVALLAAHLRFISQGESPKPA